MGFNVDPNETDRALPSVVAFEPKEPGFALDVHSNDQLSQVELDKVFGQISALMQVGIYEKRLKAVSLHDSNSEDNWLYFGKPNESFCKENLKFILQHLQMLQFESGIHKLVNTEALHDTYYKHLKYTLKNQNGKLNLAV